MWLLKMEVEYKAEIGYFLNWAYDSVDHSKECNDCLRQFAVELSDARRIAPFC